jgi:hypothetical protein
MNNMSDTQSIEETIPQTPSAKAKRNRGPRKAVTAGLLLDIHKALGLDACKQCCSANDADVVHEALTALNRTHADLAKELGYAPRVVKLAESAKVNSSRAVIVNVSCLSVDPGEQVAIERSGDTVVLRKLAQ